MTDAKTVKDLIEAIKESKDTSGSYDTTAEVVRVDGSTIYVHIPGGVAETPVARTINAKTGDVVQVRISNGSAFLVGNASAPPTDDREALAAKQQAQTAAVAAAQALNSAEQAETAAASAVESADTAASAAASAMTAATNAGTAASQAQASAATANTAANNALTQLSTVEDVVGILNWISEHGEYSASTDTEVVPGKFYFTRTGSGTSGDPYVYTVVTNPTGNPSTSGYYELDDVDEAVSAFVSSHLVLTSDGLYVIGTTNGWKALVSGGGGDYVAGFYLIDPNGGTKLASTPNGMVIYGGTSGDVEIAHLGYELTTSAEYDERAEPFFSLGSRNYENVYPYDSSRTYSYGELCSNNNKIYACKYKIETPEQWTQAHWQLATGGFSVSEGHNNIASGECSHAEGEATYALGHYSHTEGVQTITLGEYAHAEGTSNWASGYVSHAEGEGTLASGMWSHAEGYATEADGESSHAEGVSTLASGGVAHSEGEYTEASGYASHSGGFNTIAQGYAQTAIGKYNTAQGTSNSIATTDYAFIIGNGTADNARSNAFAVKWDGTVDVAGVTAIDSSGIATKAKLCITKDPPSTDADDITTNGTYFMTAAEGAAMSHLPVTITSNASMLFVVAGGSVVWQMFSFIGIDNNYASTLWIRTSINGTWRAWLPVGYPNTEPSWTAPTYNSGRGTTSYGGYYKVGRMVYVDLVVTWNGNESGGGTSSAGNNIGFITNFPKAVNYAALSCINRTKGNALVGCWVENSNSMVRLCWSSGGLATGDTLYISGQYFANS